MSCHPRSCACNTKCPTECLSCASPGQLIHCDSSTTLCLTGFTRIVCKVFFSYGNFLHRSNWNIKWNIFIRFFISYFRNFFNYFCSSSSSTANVASLSGIPLAMSLVSTKMGLRAFQPNLKIYPNISFLRVEIKFCLMSRSPKLLNLERKLSSSVTAISDSHFWNSWNFLELNIPWPWWYSSFCIWYQVKPSKDEQVPGHWFFGSLKVQLSS
jgi:hypothetical protein